jgi:tryptophan synthase alpha chain
VKARLEQRFADLRIRGEKALALFLTAGFPSRSSTLDLVLALEDGGADIVELGMPFSDPLADGPVIQHASAIALENGVSLPWILEQVAAIRIRSTMPLILMGYLNPIFRYGVERFFGDAAAAGVDGMILPELPLEEWEHFAPIVHGSGLAGILLVTPTTHAPRVKAIDEASSGFLYCVSSTGVTGGSVPAAAAAYIRDVKQMAVRNPVLVGFGISLPEHAAAFARVADGVIVGSALLRKIAGSSSPTEVNKWVREFKAVLRSPGT